MRFISDPDFWIDWSAYGLEIQMGIALCLGLVMSGQLLKNKKHISKIKYFSIFFFLITAYCLLFTFVCKHTINTLQKDITQSVEYKIGTQLEKIVKPGEKIFLSGSTVFWLNAFFDIPQVRGGVDRASVNPDWRKAAWEIREGKNAKDAKKWLKTLNIDWLVVHSPDSQEFYHDFKYPDKFEELKELEKVYDKNGDRIYRFSSQ